MSSNQEICTKPPDASLIINTKEQVPSSMPPLQPVQPPQLHPVAKHQMLPVPVVVIQAQSTPKLQNQSAATNATSNMITLPQILPVQQVNNQMVLGKTPIVLQKASSLPKNGVTYLTMLKPVSKPPDSVLAAQRLPITSISNIGSVHQKIMLAPMVQTMQMPSLTTNRLPVTVTTTSVQSKISFMPLVQTAVQNIQTLNANHHQPNQPKRKIINLKISEGCNAAKNAKSNEEMQKFVDLTSNPGGDLTITAINVDNDEESSFLCHESLVNFENSEKTTGNSTIFEEKQQNIEENTEKTYELSIIEDGTDQETLQKPENKHGVSILKRNAENQEVNPPNPSISETIVTISDAQTKEVHIPQSNASQDEISDDLSSNLGKNSPPPLIPEIPPTNNENPPKIEVMPKVESLNPPSVPNPPKRSRKSTLCLRKDFHEIEVQVSTKNNPETLKKLDFEEEKRFDTEVDEINAGSDPFNFSALLDEEFIKLLDWKQSVGMLPGSNLKFFVNEFGFLEYLTQDEYVNMGKRKEEKDLSKGKKKSRKEIDNRVIGDEEEMRCLECGCFGTVAEFINPKYCSLDCYAVGEKKAVDNANNPVNYKKKRTATNVANPPNDVAFSNPPNKKRRVEKPEKAPSNERVCNEVTERSDNDVQNPDVSDDDDASVRTEGSNYEKYPWHCRTKGFSWSKYLAHINAIGAPVKLFKDAFPYSRNCFRPGMKLEGVDPSHPSYFCVLSVAQVQGYRLQLHFDGYPKNYDFWVNADSMDIFPAGFCEKHDHVLHPPPNFPDFNWVSYLKHTKAIAAPKHLFSNRNGSAIFPTAFRVGMKLEAVDRKNTALVCVATAKDLMDSRILVHFDSWDDIYDYWADPSSPYIHPVGWCDKNGHNLTPPNDYPDPVNFTWEKYLKETNSAAAPVRAFKQRPPTGFRKGMRLECVDKRVPQLVRVACVVEVKQNRLRIAFDGWPDRYSYWVDEDHPDIHPVGWCQKTGHALEPPLTPDDVYDFMECATIGCRGVGNMKGPVFSTHSSLKYCPYAEDNIDIDSFLPDRLLSPDRELEAVVPISREPKMKKPKKKYETNATKTEWIDLEMNEAGEINNGNVGNPPPTTKIKSSNSTPSPSISPSLPSHAASMISIKKEDSEAPSFTLDERYDQEEEINQEEMRMRNKHSKYFKSFAQCTIDPSLWSTRSVVEYVQSLPFARTGAEFFAQHHIDGESFLMLTQEDLVDILNYKLGPAIALYNCILLLRRNVVNGCS